MRLPSLTERQHAAAAAKKAALERYRAALSDPEFSERRAARANTVAAREKRIAERRAAAEARKAHEEAEQAAREEAEHAAREAALEAERLAREAAAEAESAARQRAAEERAARDRALEKALMTTRKDRKAARKAKKRTGK